MDCSRTVSARCSAFTINFTYLVIVLHPQFLDPRTDSFSDGFLDRFFHGLVQRMQQLAQLHIVEMRILEIGFEHRWRRRGRSIRRPRPRGPHQNVVHHSPFLCVEIW